VNAPTLARQLEHAADAVAAVRAGRSLSDHLPRVPEALRPGVQALAFHALRRLGGAMEVRARLAPKTPPPAVEALLLTALALLWPQEDGAAPPYPDHTLVDQAVAAVRQRVPAAAAFVNAVLRRFLRERDACVQAARHSPLGAYNHPAWWVERLRQDWPREAHGLLEAANRRPPMTLRVNARRMDARTYVEQLARHGVVAHLLPLPFSFPDESDASDASGPSGASGACRAPGLALQSPAVVLAEPRAVTALPGFAAGEVSVQDVAAQLAALLLVGGEAPLRPRLPAGARVLDACAAPGGKTAHLLELAELDVTALDIDARRLTRVDDNLKRLQLPHAGGSPGSGPGRVRVLAGNACQPQSWWDGRPFDAILLDAPCTASGIVRRHPDVRWLRRPADIDALARQQAQLLATLWPLLAPGGRLLYATCSLFKAEGEHQIDAFLQRLGPGAADRWPLSPGHLLPLADNVAAREPGVSAPLPQGATRLAEGRAFGCDGFFYALIEKT
jgi:16S rRNA (cytosine967-C5)-methyltransferase